MLFSLEMFMENLLVKYSDKDMHIGYMEKLAHLNVTYFPVKHLLRQV